MLLTTVTGLKSRKTLIELKKGDAATQELLDQMKSVAVTHFVTPLLGYFFNGRGRIELPSAANRAVVADDDDDGRAEMDLFSCDLFDAVLMRWLMFLGSG